MANLRVSTPKFYIDAVLLARQWGMIQTENAEGKYYLNPSKVTDITLEEAMGGFRKNISIEFKQRYWCNSITNLFLLGHNFHTDELHLSPFIMSGATFEGYTSLAPDINGWNKHDLSSEQTTNADMNIFVSQIITATDSALGTTNTLLGDISIGWSYAMPHSPDLELTQSFSNESIKTQTTKGGHSLSNAGYNQQPKWIRPAWSTGTTDSYSDFFDDFKVFPSGRRSWNLKFSYLADDDSTSPLFPSKYNSNFGIFEYTGTMPDPDPDDEVDESASMYSIKKDFLSKVYHGTNNFQNSFLFQPNQAEDEYAICRINGDTASFNQVANNVYDVSLDITEVW